jgi:hypothetical protein
MLRNIMSPDPEHGDRWIPLVPAAARSNRSDRELLALVDGGRLPGFVERADGRRRLVFRMADVDELGSTS